MRPQKPFALQPNIERLAVGRGKTSTDLTTVLLNQLKIINDVSDAT